jgi:hypothetical protein
MLGPFLGTPPPRNDKEKGSACRGLGDADSMPSDVVALCSAPLLRGSLLSLRQELVPYAGYFDRSRSFSKGPPYATAHLIQRSAWKAHSSKSNFRFTQF